MLAVLCSNARGDTYLTSRPFRPCPPCYSARLLDHRCRDAHLSNGRVCRIIPNIPARKLRSVVVLPVTILGTYHQASGRREARWGSIRWACPRDLKSQKTAGASSEVFPTPTLPRDDSEAVICAQNVRALYRPSFGHNASILFLTSSLI